MILGLVFALALTALQSISSSSAAAAEARAKAPAPADFSLGYPELLVEPKASLRLERESSAYQASRWAPYRTIQVSAATTLVASVLQISSLEADPSKTRYSGAVGLAVGGGWLAATSLMALGYHPYSDAWEQVSKMPQGSPAEKLSRERYAEEALRSASRMARTLSWISVISNFGASAYLLVEASKDTIGRPAGGVSAVVALAPLIFSQPWIEAWSNQESYKKRIYGPLVQATWMQPVANSPAAPAILATFRF